MTIVYRNKPTIRYAISAQSVRFEELPHRPQDVIIRRNTRYSSTPMNNRMASPTYRAQR